MKHNLIVFGAGMLVGAAAVAVAIWRGRILGAVLVLFGKAEVTPSANTATAKPAAGQ